MISFTTQGVAFQVRAAAVLIHDGRVLVHRAEGDDFWTSGVRQFAIKIPHFFPKSPVSTRVDAWFF